jgi:hypothetical protein
VAEQNEWVTVRQLSGQLPDAKAHSGRLESSEGKRLRVGIPPLANGNGTEFKVGALVEVQSERVLYLGVVLGKQDSAMSIAIEHTVDREALVAIQEVWHGSPGVVG